MKNQLSILLAGFGDIAERFAQCNPEGDRLAAACRSERESPTIDFHYGDLTDSGFVSALFESHWDVVVVTMTPKAFSDDGYQDSYVAAATAIAGATASGQPPGLVIWVSSTSVYGEGNGEWVDENSPANPTSFSGRRLLEAESIIGGLPCEKVIIRFSGIYGPGRNRMIEQVKTGLLVSPEPVVWTNRIHADDCARVIGHLIDKYRNGESMENLYIGTDCKPAPQADVQNWLASQMNVEIKSRVAPSPRANRRCRCDRLKASGFEWLYPDYQSGYRKLLDES
ncbi:MAG: NAD-dependent epimerase/dehydratase family protein [bacterium]